MLKTHSANLFIRSEYAATLPIFDFIALSIFGLSKKEAHFERHLVQAPIMALD
jgi:hypothetical protein